MRNQVDPKQPVVHVNSFFVWCGLVATATELEDSERVQTSGRKCARRAGPPELGGLRDEGIALHRMEMQSAIFEGPQSLARRARYGTGRRR